MRHGDGIVRKARRGADDDADATDDGDVVTDADVAQRDDGRERDADGATTAAGTAAPIEETLDRLSLRQALLDFDVANARVVDLSARLVDAQRELAEVRRTRAEVEALEAETTALRAELADVTFRYEEILRSRTYRVALLLRRARERFGV